MSVRVVIYGRGTAADVERQQLQCGTRAVAVGHEVVGVASDPPDGHDGWLAASHMVEVGEADRVLVVSRRVLPMPVESVTGELPGLLPGDRRPRRIDRPE